MHELIQELNGACEKLDSICKDFSTRTKPKKTPKAKASK